MYYNTNGHSNPDLEMFTEKANTQDYKLKQFVFKYKKPFSAKDVYNDFQWRDIPITSIRRSINTLLKESFIEETGEKVQGIYSRKERQYRLKN